MEVLHAALEESGLGGVSLCPLQGAAGDLNCGIYGSRNFAVTFPGIVGSEEEVGGQERSKARVRAIFHSG